MQDYDLTSKAGIEAKANELGIKLPWSEDIFILAQLVRAGSLVIPNSLAVHPMEGADGDSDGRPGELTLRRYKRFAAGVFFVIAELHIKYRRPALYDERLELLTTCTGVSASKVEHSYKLTRPATGEILAEGASVLACVDTSGKIRRIPEFMYPEA